MQSPPPCTPFSLSPGPTSEPHRSYIHLLEIGLILVPTLYSLMYAVEPEQSGLHWHIVLVIGIEIDAPAVSDAERNAKLNGMSNWKFICSKVEYLDKSEMEATVQDNEQIPS
ncbi:unnamed protein product [Thlaspi arvense]|uniref:Uncharacterized protein n=1 Tax=Thlaspi arvense TaxID=13288 RepID=A0AAU9SPQ7_THLAR|nr:unnamed protein product [Thlaspi arvense]